MNLIPSPKHIIVRPLASKEKTTAGGVVIPEAVGDDRDSTLLEGVVLAMGASAGIPVAGAQGGAGSGCFVLYPGATVLYARYAGFTRNTDEGPVKFLCDDDIVAIVTTDE